MDFIISLVLVIQIKPFTATIYTFTHYTYMPTYLHTIYTYHIYIHKYTHIDYMHTCYPQLHNTYTEAGHTHDMLHLMRL